MDQINMFEANQLPLFNSEALRPKSVFKDPKEAFEQAIASGRLSADKSAPNYAGKYMYMGPGKGGDAFKHIVTREYID